ncbi:MAG: hypothetical protein IT381_05460 [Deltaproteobacteria bacterium]|nr:hypothetical protein [Deltaproteobacteria bacterium]
MEKLKQQFQELIAKITEAFSRLSEREKTVALGIATVVTTLTVVGLSYSMIRAIDRTSKQIAVKSEQLRDILSMRDVYRRAQDQTSAFKMKLQQNDLRLVALVEDETKKLGIEMGSLQPNSDSEPGASGIKVQTVDFRVMKLSYDKLTALLRVMEEQVKPVRILRLKVTSRFDEKDLVDAEITVATYKVAS